MLQNITYFPILGKPLILYLGFLVLLSFVFTASIAALNKKGIHKIPFVWHLRMAKISFILAIIHGLLAFLAYF